MNPFLTPLAWQFSGVYEVDDVFLFEEIFHESFQFLRQFYALAFHHMKLISDLDSWWIKINQSFKNHCDETTPVIEMIEKKVDS